MSSKNQSNPGLETTPGYELVRKIDYLTINNKTFTGSEFVDWEVDSTGRLTVTFLPGSFEVEYADGYFQREAGE